MWVNINCQKLKCTAKVKMHSILTLFNRKFQQNCTHLLVTVEKNLEMELWNFIILTCD